MSWSSSGRQHRGGARRSSSTRSCRSADRLERLTNQLVNMAEADMVAAIEATEGAYGTSRVVVVSFAVGSILLALGLGYIISWSLIQPVKKIETRLGQIAAGDFTATGRGRQSRRARGARR